MAEAAEQCILCRLPQAVLVEVEGALRRGVPEARQTVIDAGHQPPSEASFRRHRDNHMALDVKAAKDNLTKIAELLEQSGIPLEQIGSVDKVTIGTYQALTKNEDTQEAEIHTLERAAIVVSPTWSEGPAWPVVQQAAPVTNKHTAAPRRPARSEDAKVTALLPDPQIGYRRYDDGLVPMHDERAMACTLQILGAIRPDRVINLGDFLDLAEWSSKFLVEPEFVFTTQPSIDRGHKFLAEQRAAVGADATIDLIEGNHCDRLAIAVAKNAMAALRLRQANTPESWPVLSFPHLLRLDDLGVDYLGAYPAGRLKVAGAHGEQTPLYALHGEKLDMQKQARSERQSTVQGHSHHLSCHSETYDVDGEPQQVQSWSIGCLCRLDGHVPSTKGGTDPHGRPFPRIESWQHAMAVVTETDAGWWLEPIAIHDGRAVYAGQVFEAA